MVDNIEDLSVSAQERYLCALHIIFKDMFQMPKYTRTFISIYNFFWFKCMY